MYDSIIILGPTACGKTKVSIELAKIINGEIINADSMYIYKQLNIGTAKPTFEEMDNVPHHLIDIVDPRDSFNVSQFRELAKSKIYEIQSRGKIPIVVGGTGFYIDSLISDYSYGNVERNIKLRDELESLVRAFGNEYIHNRLKEVDTDAARKIHVNDKNRIIRAIEIAISGNKDFINNDNPILKNPLLIGLNYPREILYDRINARVDMMVDNGLIEEVSSLVNTGLNPNSHQSMKGIGYKEIVDYLNGEYCLNDAIDKIKQHTRNYAKRQITWFKRNKDIVWIDMSTNNNITHICSNIINMYNA